MFRQDKLMAWCIVPYDSRARTPSERVAMLKQLGFSQYAYDWRDHHLSSFAEEIEAARAGGIQLSAVWAWIDKDWDEVGRLNRNTQRMLDILGESGLSTRLWVGFNGNYFEGLDEPSRIDKALEMVRYLRSHVPPNVTGLGLYNHGDWFGEPENQVKVLKLLRDPAVGIVYNFHHAHDQIDRFPAMLQEMLPWLWTVNLNGVTRGASKIMTVGTGESEIDMLRALQASGFDGSIGVLGHIEDEDVQVVLQRNLDGLRTLAARL